MLKLPSRIVFVWDERIRGVESVDVVRRVVEEGLCLDSWVVSGMLVFGRRDVLDPLLGNNVPVEYVLSVCFGGSGFMCSSISIPDKPRSPYWAGMGSSEYVTALL